MSIQPVIELLQMMRSLHEQLIELAKQKTRVLIENNTVELMKITKQENKLIKKIEETDHHRRLWIAAYLQSKNFPVQYTITVSEFSKYLFHPEEKKALLDEQALLLQTLKNLKDCNESNQTLIGEALKYVDFSIDLMTFAGDDIVYKKPDQQSNGVGRSSLFDSKA
jgi:hypothetical protein